MVRTLTNSFEMSSESNRERQVLIPWARLADQTPTKGDPAMVTGLIAGEQMTGTVYNAGVAVTDPYVVLNVAEGRMERQNVRNVLTYAGAEASWGIMNIGDPVFYDVTSDANNGVKLSTSPLNTAGAANPRFGVIIMLQNETSASFGKGVAQSGSTHECGVLCCGLNN